MPIAFRCPCDQDLEVDDQYAGQEVSCPTCQTVVVAPAKPRRAVAQVIAAPPRRAKAQRIVPDDDDDRGYEVVEQRRPRRPRRANLEDEQIRVRGKKKKRKPAEESRSLEGGVINGGVVGGLIAMLIAVIWFVVGMAAGWVFFYPPILFIIGLVGVVKGLVMGGDD